MGNTNRLEGTEYLEDPVGHGHSSCIYYAHTYFFTTLSEPQTMQSLILKDRTTLK